MKGRDRNTLCWCGSGKKLKKCHWNREHQDKDNPWEAIETNRRAFKVKRCFACGVGLGACDGGVIHAHTVSRGPNLAKIAESGHVVKYKVNLRSSNGKENKLSVSEIGIRDASVFFGFCRKHDREIFSCIENEPFTGRPDQCLAVAYRTMSRELYGKDAAAHMRETLRDADKGLSPLEQISFQRMLDEVNTGNEAARREARATHEFLTSALVNKQPEAIRSLVLQFASPLPFMFAGAWSPFTDFYGNDLQDGYGDKLLEQVFVSSFSGEPHPYICVSWRNVANAPGGIIAEQLQALPLEKQASGCLQIVAKHVENLFFAPKWFYSLHDEQREQIDLLVASGVDIMGSVPSAPIRLNINFDLPTAKRAYQV